jgi:hypothetical protein
LKHNGRIEVIMRSFGQRRALTGIQPSALLIFLYPPHHSVGATTPNTL